MHSEETDGDGTTVGGRMSRKSKIDRQGLRDKVLTYASSGMSQVEIIKQIEREHPGTNLNPASLCLYLKKHGQMIQVKAAESKDNEIKLTITSIRQTLVDTAKEIQGKLRDYVDDPRAFAAYLKLKLEVIDRMAKMLGAYAPDSLVVVPPVLECDTCPNGDYRGGWTRPLPIDYDRIGNILAILNDCGALSFPCPNCGKIVSNIPTLLPYDTGRTTSQEEPQRPILPEVGLQRVAETDSTERTGGV